MTTVSFVCVRSEVEINQKRKVARPFLFEKLFWHLGCTRILCVRKLSSMSVLVLSVYYKLL